MGQLPTLIILDFAKPFMKNKAIFGVLYTYSMHMKAPLALVATGVFSTIAFFNPIFEPNILPKFMFLIIGSLISLYIFLKSSKLTSYTSKLLILLSIVYSLLLIIGGVKNKQTVYEILVGSWGRNNGLLAVVCFFILFIIGSLSKFSEYPKLIIKALVLLGYIMVFIGLLEYFGYNFMNVNAQDPHIKLTLGNSNYASIFLVITFIATFTTMIFTKKSRSIQSFLIASLIGQLFLIYHARASQGYVTLFFSIMFLTGAWIIKEKGNLSNKFGYGIWATIPLIGTLTIYSILSRNSLGNFLSASSLYDRFYAWQAALAMLKQNLFFGVGIDSYGLWFQKFRSLESAQKQLVSENFDNAHNIFLNIAATGGLLLFIIYFLLICLIAYRCYLIIKLKLYDGYLIGLIGIWLVYQLQSIVSIDHITLNTWHWIVAGAIYSSSYTQATTQSSEIKRSNKVSRFLFTPILMLIAILVYISPTIITEYRINQLTYKKSFILGSNEMKNAGSVLLNLSLDSRYPEIRIYSIYTLMKFGYLSDAMKLALDTTTKFPRSINSWEALAQIYEMSGDKKLAAESWKTASNLAPFNSAFSANILKNSD
jgi:O-antigen ligase